MNFKALADTVLNNIDYVSIVVISVITIIFVMAIVYTIILFVKYKKLLKDLEQVNYEGMEIYKNKMLNGVVGLYKEAYQKSNDFVNTQAIIESSFYKHNLGLLGIEKFLNNCTNMMITVGIVGTLYGIVVISTDLTNIFWNASNAGIQMLQSVLGNISTVLSFLAIAFITTFIAVLASFLYSLISSFANISLLRKNVFARLEDYLDNELGASLSKTNKRLDINVNDKQDQKGDNSNILYMLENTSNSMMDSTRKLEATISQLNENIRNIIDGDDFEIVAMGEEKKEEKPKEFINLEKSKEILNKKSEKRELENRNNDRNDYINNFNNKGLINDDFAKRLENADDNIKKIKIERPENLNDNLRTIDNTKSLELSKEVTPEIKPEVVPDIMPNVTLNVTPDVTPIVDNQNVNVSVHPEEKLPTINEVNVNIDASAAPVMPDNYAMPEMPQASNIPTDGVEEQIIQISPMTSESNNESMNNEGANAVDINKINATEEEIKFTTPQETDGSSEDKKNI